MINVIKHKYVDKCSKCGTENSKTFWDYKDGSVLCDNCEHLSKINSPNPKQKDTSSVQTYFQPATFERRFWAYMIDSVLVIYALIFLGAFVSEISELLGGLIIFFAIFVYFLIKDALPNGQSVGKLLLGLKVVKYSDQSVSCSIIQSILRNVILYVPFVTLCAAFQIDFDDERRRIGDGLADTIVVNLNKPLK